MMTKSYRFLCILIVLSLCLVVPAVAQRDLGTILGVVADPTGAVIPGADVTLTQDATGQVWALQTDAGGNYIRPALQPGTYSVTVETPGFKSVTQRNVTLTGGSRVELNITLTVGEVTESIEVSSAPPALKTESTELGADLNSKNTAELPLGGRRVFSYLARLSPAVVPNEPGARDNANGGFSANGVRSNGQNNFLLNGVDNNVNVIDFINETAYVVGPSVEAIGEMKVITNGYNAEYGRGAGGVVQVSTKSGTNQFHGLGYWMHQNDNFDANRWENNRSGVGKGERLSNEFGANLGAPIIKDKLFFFINYRGIRERQGGATSTLTIPWDDMKRGDFSRLLTSNKLGTDALGNDVFEGQIFDPFSETVVGGERVRQAYAGNLIPQSQWDSAATKLLSLYPSANTNLGDRVPSNNYIIGVPLNRDVDQGDFRVDWRASDKDSLFFAGSWHESLRTRGAPLGILDATGFGGEVQDDKPRNIMASWTRVWTPTVLTEVRAAYTRLVTSRLQANSTTNGFDLLGIGGIDTCAFFELNCGIPQMNLGDYSNVGASDWLPTKEWSNVWDFMANVSINKGNHAIKFGAEYRPVDFPFFQFPSSHGRFNFRRDRTASALNTGNTGDTMASMLIGSPARDTRLSTANLISSNFDTWSFYVQDDWKVSPKLTVNVGLRYEIYSPLDEWFGRQANLEYWNTPVVLTIPKGNNQDAPLPPNFATDFNEIVVERGLKDSKLIPTNYNNFGPRIGFAYQLTDDMVIRAGYGLFFGGEENEGGNPNRGEGLPFNQEVRLHTEQMTNLDANPFIDTFSDGFPLDTFSLPAPITFRSVPERQTPFVHKWNASIQRQLGWATTFEASYIGSKGTHLKQNFDANAPINDASAPNLPTGPRRWMTPLVRNMGGISTTETLGRSWYHGLSGSLVKRFSDGLDFNVGYTWSHALTDVGTTLSGSGRTTRDPRDFSFNYADAQFDMRHRFTTAALYELPFGTGRKVGTNWSKTTDMLLGNWQINAILSIYSGFPFSATTSFRGGSFGAYHPDPVSGKNPNAAPSGGRTPDQWWDASAVQNPAMGSWGALGNNYLKRPGQQNLDFSIFKRFPLTERFQLVYRAEFLNIFNTPFYGDPGRNFRGDTSNPQDGGYARITGTNGNPRQIQMMLRVEF
jgi:outer membrane receptor protein involved in Fe transport